MRSASANTCSSRCEMSRIAVPASRRSARRRSTSLVSATPSEAVGSSRTSTAGLRAHGAGDGDELSLPAREGADGAVQVDRGQVEPSEQLRRLVDHRAVVEEAAAEVLAAEEEVGDDAEVVAEGQVLPHHRDPLVQGADRVGGQRPTEELDGPGVARARLRDAAHHAWTCRRRSRRRGRGSPRGGGRGRRRAAPRGVRTASGARARAAPAGRASADRRRPSASEAVCSAAARRVRRSAAGSGRRGTGGGGAPRGRPVRRSPRARRRGTPTPAGRRRRPGRLRCSTRPSARRPRPSPPASSAARWPARCRRGPPPSRP